MEALMIGVSGLRGTVGGTLTPMVAMRMASAFACWLKQTQKPANGRYFRVVVGRDGRPSGPYVRDAVFSGLMASGIETVDLDIVTTPGVAMMVKHARADAGLVITASHNPIQWNGIKLLTRDSVAPPPDAVAEIRKLYDDQVTSYERVENLAAPARNTETHALHTKRILDYIDVLGVSSKRYKVVLDSVNGAGCVATNTLLSKLGCSVIHINNTPNGQFPHEPEPTKANLTQLADEVKRHGAVVGFAQDPDADRLAIIDEHGEYIGEEYSLVLCAQWLLSKKPGVAVTNLSTSRMLDDIAARNGSRVIRTPVGEAHVVDAMIREKAVVGGEGNGGVIDLRVVPGRDSMVGMAYVLQLMADTGKTISQLVAQTPKYEIVKSKFECRREDAERAVAAIRSRYASEKIDVQDGIRIDWPDAWVHARASNTEPIMRIIAEAPDRATADARIAAVQEVVKTVL
ncbi:MAG: phosphoglucosamine mutase [Burkholderiales bacterium]|nr:phosphoglucosamine mutase [Phycisphaerae bacterium]